MVVGVAARGRVHAVHANMGIIRKDRWAMERDAWVTQKTIVSVASAVVLLVLGSVLGGCGSSSVSVAVAGNYCLSRSDISWTYAVTGCSWRARLHGETDNGPMDGDVIDLGSDGRFIVARVTPMAGVEKPGWWILDARAETIVGPLSDEEWNKRAQQPPLSRIEVLPVKVAWERYWKSAPRRARGWFGIW